LTTRIKILCEDKYGVGFLKELTNRLKDEGLMPIVHVSVSKFYGACNPKTERQIKAMVYFGSFNSFLIVVDADGRPEKPVEKRVEVHIPNEFRDSTHTIIFEYEIED